MLENNNGKDFAVLMKIMEAQTEILRNLTTLNDLSNRNYDSLKDTREILYDIKNNFNNIKYIWVPIIITIINNIIGVAFYIYK